MDERIKQIADHYGYDKQKIQLMEEMGELMQAVSKYDRAETCDRNTRSTELAKELVDVQIMIDQMREFFDVSNAWFGVIYNNKLDRQIIRIKEEELVSVIDAVHYEGGKEYCWRVPIGAKVPQSGQIVFVHAKGTIQPVIVKRTREIKRKFAKDLKTVVGDNIEQQK